MPVHKEDKKMKDTMNIYYDEEGDLLEIQIGEPTPSYYEEVSDGVFERRDEKTNKTKGFAVFSFRKRLSSKKDINVPLPAHVQLNF